MSKFFSYKLPVIILLVVTPLFLYANEEETHHGKVGLGFDLNLYPGEEDMETFVGLHARLRFSESVGLEAEIHLRSTVSEDQGIDITSQPLSFSLMYFLLPKSILSFYLFGGITFSKPTFKYSDPEPTEETGEWERGLHGGIGIETPLSSVLILHFEIRYNDLSFTISGFEFDYSGLAYSGGISFYF